MKTSLPFAVLACSLLLHGAASLSITKCNTYLNELCVDIEDTKLRLYIESRPGEFFEMFVKLKSVWLSNPIRPVVQTWRNCVADNVVQNSTLYNETVVNCDAVGFQGTQLTFTVRMYESENGTFSDGTTDYPIQPGSIELLYNLQYSQACIQDTSNDINCTAEEVIVSHHACTCPALSLNVVS